MKIILKVLGGLLIVLLLMMAFVAVKFSMDGNNPYSNSIDDSLVPSFKQVPTGFTHRFNSEESLPVTASVLIDIDNDGVDELFLGGGFDQQDELLRYADGKFTSISKQVGLPDKSKLTSLAGASTDFDNNGFADLVVSREDGVTIYYNTGGKFTPTKIAYDLADNATPLGLAFGDVNKDGHTDIFLANYIRKKQMVGQNNFSKTYGPKSLLLLNNGDNTFTNATTSAGLDYTHNTFMGIFVDIDNDTWLDLIVAHDTGEIRTYKNKGDGTFEIKDNPSTNKYGYPMGIAVGDYNNDGLVDFMFSNTGSTVPVFMASGDIEDKSLFNSDWYFFENQGGFVFKDVAKETLTKDYEFSWGAVFADMNNDGLQELIVAENYVAFPPHKMFKLPGRFLVQKDDHTFVATEEKSGVVNPNYGITPLTSDFNQDGYLDLVWVNLDSPVSAYINNGGENNFLKVKLADNATDLGAKVQVLTESGKRLTEDYVVGEGLTSDQSSTLHFGLGSEKAKSLTVKYISGKAFKLDAPKTNTLIDIPSLVALDTIVTN